MPNTCVPTSAIISPDQLKHHGSRAKHAKACTTKMGSKYSQWTLPQRRFQPAIPPRTPTLGRDDVTMPPADAAASRLPLEIVPVDPEDVCIGLGTVGVEGTKRLLALSGCRGVSQAETCLQPERTHVPGSTIIATRHVSCTTRLLSPRRLLGLPIRRRIRGLVRPRRLFSGSPRHLVCSRLPPRLRSSWKDSPANGTSTTDSELVSGS